MNGFLYVIIVAFFLNAVGVVSAAFWFYWPSSWYLAYQVRSSRCTPGALFAQSVMAQVLLLVTIGCSSGIVPFVALIVPFGGFIGWIVLGVQWLHAAFQACWTLQSRNE